MGFGQRAYALNMAGVVKVRAVFFSPGGWKYEKEVFPYLEQIAQTQHSLNKICILKKGLCTWIWF